MKKILIVLIMPLMLLSCGKFEEVDLGYPQTVTFSAEGGEKVISGVEQFTHAEIHNYDNGDNGVSSQEGDVQKNKYEWLTVEYVNEGVFASEVKIIAKPNTSGEKRGLWIELISGYEYHVIYVEQNN